MAWSFGRSDRGDDGQYLTIVIDLSSKATPLRRRDCLLPPAKAATRYLLQ